MKKRTLSCCLLVFLLTPFTTLSAQDWPAAGIEARPATRWWWLGSAVDEANLTYNMQEYARAGIGGVEITPIYGVQGNDSANIPFLSPRWMDILQYTQAEGKRLDMEVDMNTGTGWPFGGPQVSVADAACKAIFQSYDVEGGGETSLDVQVQEEEQRGIALLSRAMAYSEDGTCLDLTSKVKEGTLQWNAPAGTWRVVVLYVGRTLQQVKRAAPGGEGYVMDHLDKGAVGRYLSRFDKAFKENNTPFPHTFFNDSYEVYGADWTPGFLEAFAKRRGYKLEEHFPEFLDKTRSDATARVVSDYRETMSELLIENFTDQWTAWAHSHGCITRNQAHGSPSNLIDTYAAVDIPECEGFGLSNLGIEGLRQDNLTRKNFSDLTMLKYASSAAHITGKPFTSSETFTWLTEHFRTSLSQCKPDMDLMFAQGVNHAFFHGTPYSPKEARWPGWKFYASVDMSPTNNIWRDAPSLFEYITRCQSFLQAGKPDNDFLLYLPIYDIWQENPGRALLFSIHDMARFAPKFIETVNDIWQCGYDMDYISDKYLMSTRVEGGQLVTTGGTTYKAIIVPDVQLMPVETLKQLLKLAQAGATVVFTGNYPQDVPGYGRLEQRRKAFAQIQAQLPAIGSFETSVATPCGKGRVITGGDYPATLALSGASAESMKTHYGLQCIRRADADGYHYFIASLQSKGVDAWVTLAVPAESAMLFNPMTGEKGAVEVRQEDGKAAVRLQLRSGESVILETFNHPLTSEVETWHYLKEQPVSLGIDHGWTLHFAQSEPRIEGTFPIDTPSSWTSIDHPNATTTMATGVYTTTITLPDIPADDWLLDLGDVRESARVRVNGQEAGCAWAVPFRLKVGKWLHQGENTLEVEVTNLPANRIADMDRRGEKWRIFNEINMVKLDYRPGLYDDWPPMPSGLNSAVKLIPVDYE